MRSAFTSMIAVVSLLAGCNLQGPYQTPEFVGPPAWSTSSLLSGQASPEKWWKELDDPAINTLIAGAYSDNPTLAQAIARIDEAKANVAVNRADQFPSITATASATSAYSKSSGGAGAGVSAATTGEIPGHSQVATVEPSFSWELDLFGRIRSSVTEARETLSARSADASSTRLSLGIDIANGVLDLRSCNYAAQIDYDALDSYRVTLEAVHRKTSAGFSSSVDEASAERDLANSGTSLTAQLGTCATDMNALVALTGRDKAFIAKLVADPLTLDAADITTQFIPRPPQALPQLPATVLLHHPSVIAADRDAAAAWAEVGVYKADRFPRIDLAAALTGEWIRFAGSTISSRSWSLGPTFSSTLFDAGKGAANVDAAEARYRQSAAKLQSTVRTTVRDVENALSDQHSADTRLYWSTRSVGAAKTAFDGSQAQWKSGMNSLIELEDSHRQYEIAENNLVAAAHDRAKAWTALVGATANNLTIYQSDSNEH